MEYLLTDQADEALKAQIKKQVNVYNADHMPMNAQEVIIRVNDAQGNLGGRPYRAQRLGLPAYRFLVGG